MRRVLSPVAKKAISGYGMLAQHLSSSRHSIIKLSPNNNATFFGYYDKTPFSQDNSLVLGMNLREEVGRAVDIGYFDLRDGNRFKTFGESTTWSWQLGTRLQWLPNNESEVVAYNKSVAGRCGSVLQNVHTKKTIAEYDDPIFDISSNGRYAISINFARLHRMRAGYGYGNYADPTAGDLCPSDDGIVLFDLETKSRKLLITLASLRAFEPHSSMEGAEHYVNHLAFSPSGSRFMFLHIWNNGDERYCRPITSDIHGDRLFALENEMSMSHYAWKSDTQLLIHTAAPAFRTKYVLYEDLTGNKKIVGEDVLNEPGHPSYSPNGRLLVVDTYPDRTRRQTLSIHTSDGGLIEEVGRFHSPIKFARTTKCDLHPRWNRDGSQICIDSAHSGQRAMYIVGLN